MLQFRLYKEFVEAGAFFYGGIDTLYKRQQRGYIFRLDQEFHAISNTMKTFVIYVIMKCKQVDS